MSWSRAFDEPIQPPKGNALVTLRDAASYLMALPGKTRQPDEWQAAIEALLMAAEDRGPLMHAHVGMMLALHGAKPIPEYDSSMGNYSIISIGYSVKLPSRAPLNYFAYFGKWQTFLNRSASVASRLINVNKS
jgi:hypothetical protein